MAFLYIVECKGVPKNTYYTGIAKDIAQRLKEHWEKGAACAKYTRSHPVVAVLALWETENLRFAAKGECAVKALTRKQKEALIADAEQLTSVCPGLMGLPFTVRRDVTLANCLNKTEC